MSRKAKMRSLSKSLKEGISPIKVLINACKLSKKQRHTLDYLAENTGGSHGCFNTCTFVICTVANPRNENLNKSLERQVWRGDVLVYLRNLIRI